MLLYNQEILNMNVDSSTLNKTKEKIKELQEELKNSGDFDALSIAYEQDDLEDIQHFADFLSKNFAKILILGIGGSSLGAKTILSLMHQDKVEIFENIDSDSVKFFFNKLDLKNTAFLTISKSGKTIECISQTLILLKMVEDKLGKDEIAKHFFFLTENKDSPITQLAKEFGIKTLEHHKTIGGRFSYLSNVGLLPCAIAGFNIKEIRDGAKDTLKYLFDNEDNFIVDIVAKQNQLYHNGIVANILMTYCERLQKLGEWYRQLWSESLGKEGFGILPVTALGTVDQHSQLQLYMDGPKNLFYTFILKEKDELSLKIEKSYNNYFDYLVGMSFDDIMDIEAKSTIEVLNVRKLPIRIFNIKEINERMISQLMMQYIIETILIAKLNNINPFGQTCVEERKVLAHSMYKK